MVYKDRKTVGVLMPNLDWWYYDSIARGIITEANKRSVNIRLFVSGFYGINEKLFKLQDIFSQMLNQNILDGLISISGGMIDKMPPDLLNRCFDRIDPLPVVSLGMKLRDYPVITVDNEAGMSELVVHLIEKHGYRHIAFVSGPLEHEEARIRLDAYKKVLHQYGIPFDPAYVTGTSYSFNKIYSSKIIRTIYDERKLKPEAIVCANDDIAIGLYRQLKTSGLVIPDDVALTGFDGITGVYSTFPPLTTVKQPLVELGTGALDMVLEMITTGKKPEDKKLPARLLIQSSCGCPEPPLFSRTAPRPLLTSTGISKQDKLFLKKIYSKILRLFDEKKEKTYLLRKHIDKNTLRSVLKNLYREITASKDEGPAPDPKRTAGEQKGAEKLHGEKQPGLFLQALKKTVYHDEVSSAELDEWKELVEMVLSDLKQSFGEHRVIRLIEQKVFEARALFSRIEIKLNRIEKDKLLDDFREFWVDMQILMNCHSRDELLKMLRMSFSQLHITSAYLSLYGESGKSAAVPGVLPEKTRLMLGYDGKQIVHYPGGIEYKTGDLLPDKQFLFDSHNIFVTQLLQAGDSCFGFLTIEYNDNYFHYFEMINSTLNLQFNRFEQIDQIKKTNISLDDLNKNLELKVKERTGELEQANERLKELDIAKTNFMANISHELRTPLTLILGPQESLMAGDYGNPLLSNKNVQDVFKAMHTNSVRLLRLINNLLDFSKIEAGKMQLTKEFTELNKLIRFYVNSIHSGLQSSGLKIEFISSGESITVAIDRDLIEKAFFNLISNAMKFSRRAGTITIILAVKDDEVHLTVQDRGVGIPQNKLDSIFERFTQVEQSTSRAFEGTGIGLAFTKEIVELHKGRITVESEVGKGSVFTIILPYGKERENTPGPEKEGFETVKSWLTAEFNDQETSEPPLLPENFDAEENACLNDYILVVDDNSSMRTFIKNLLKRKYPIVTAVHGKDALAIMDRRLPGLIISDVMMPVMDGLELCSIIKSKKETAGIPIILLTARMDIATRIEGLEGKADDFLIKPFNARELFARIENLLEKRRLELELQATTNALWSEMETAKQIQSSLLPKNPRIPGFETACFIQSASQVSGDYYDVITAGDKTYLVIGDVSGHGVTAGLVMMMVQTALNTLIKNNPAAAPSDLLCGINSTIKNNIGKLNQEKYMTITIFCLDEQGDVVYSGLHQDIFIYRAGSRTIEVLESEGMWIGFINDISAHVKDSTFKLEKGDTLLLYTDGITEAVRKEWQPGQPGKRFGEDKLKQILKTNGHKKPALIKTALQQKLEGYICDDDFTFVILQSR